MVNDGYILMANNGCILMVNNIHVAIHRGYAVVHDKSSAGFIIATNW